MASSSNDKICIRCGESLKENDPLNYMMEVDTEIIKIKSTLCKQF